MSFETYGSYDSILLILGLSFLAAAVLPYLLGKAAGFLPLIYVLIGLLLSRVWYGPVRFDPVEHGDVVERLTELAVIISLMSAGLKLDRPIGWRAWRSTWRLLGVTMPLCIAALTLAGSWLMGLPLAVAILLGASLAPTDPVLATSVQVGPPGEGHEDEPRFALTSEAGLNDGLAFPFVYLAIVVAATGLAGGELLEWLAIDVGWRIFAGVVVGGLVGQLVAILALKLGDATTVSDGFVAIALTLAAYGAAEMASGYGFLGVFVAGLTFRHFERAHTAHPALHAFSEQMEQMLMAVLLILFGASIAHGLFGALTWTGAGVGIAMIILIRPLAGMLGLIGTSIPRRDRLAISVFGIRGIGTFYYLAYALNHAEISVAHSRVLWATAGFIVLLSIVLHGATAAAAFRHVDRRRGT